MIDNFALALSHGLLLLTAWRLLWRPDLNDDDADSAAPARRPFRKPKDAPNA
ncbi:MAG TPA: hypothetical protein VJ859_04610 [Allosphingosinicella sp.]|nr:hypothetical protein [Allosphingosinicella sp.]